MRYVDFGNKISVPVADLRRIKEEFFALPILVRRFVSVFYI